MPVIRPAESDDTDGIQRVARTTWHTTYDEMLGPDTVDTQVDEWYVDAAVREGVTSDEATYLVATIDGSVVGYASTGPSDDESGHASLYAIYVLSDHCGSGLGTRLLDAVTDRLRIHVFADNNRARWFYERHGYTQSERQRIELADVTTTEVVYDGPLAVDDG